MEMLQGVPPDMFPMETFTNDLRSFSPTISSPSSSSSSSSSSPSSSSSSSSSPSPPATILRCQKDDISSSVPSSPTSPVSSSSSQGLDTIIKFGEVFHSPAKESLTVEQFRAGAEEQNSTMEPELPQPDLNVDASQAIIEIKSSSAAAAITTVTTITAPSPPPPQLGSFLPPPPPPLGSFFVPPPPPPPFLCGALKPGSAHSSLSSDSTTKFKRLQWHKLPEHALKDPESVWSGVANEINSSDLKINFDNVKKLFSIKPSPSPSNRTLRKGSSFRAGQSECSSGDSDPMEEVYSILDRSKCVNIGIILHKFQMPVDEVLRCAVQGDTRSGAFKWSVDDVRTLAKSLPEVDELKRLKDFRGPVDKLGPAEQFCIKLSRIEGYEYKLEFRTLRDEFEQGMFAIKMGLEAVVSCGSAILKSQILKEVLAVILLIGNHLNSGSHAGRALGFKMASLLVLMDMRSQDNKTTMIHYVVQELERNGKDVDLLKEEFVYLSEASLHSLNGLSQKLNSLKEMIQRFKCLAKMIEDEAFQKKINSFVQFAEKETGDVESDVSIVKKLNENLSKYFCEQEFKMEECFKNLNSFCEACCRAKQENLERKRLAEEAERRRKERLQFNSVRDFNSLEKKRTSETSELERSPEFDPGKAIRCSARKSWTRMSHRSIHAEVTFDDEVTTEHESLLDFLEGSTTALTVRRSRSLKNSCLNSSFVEPDRWNSCRLSLCNINNDTRERLPERSGSPFPFHEPPASSTPIPPNGPITDDIRGSNSQMLSALARQIDDYIRSNKEAKDEGFESDRLSDSQRSSVCSSADNETSSPSATDVILNSGETRTLTPESTDERSSLVISETMHLTSREICQDAESPRCCLAGSNDQTPCTSPPKVEHNFKDSKVTPFKACTLPNQNSSSRSKSDEVPKTVQVVNRSQVSRRLFGDSQSQNMKSSPLKFEKTPTKKGGDVHKLKESKSSTFSPNRRLVQRSVNEKIKDRTVEGPGMLVRGSARRKTIEPSVLNKNKKIAQTATGRTSSTSASTKPSSSSFSIFATPRPSSVINRTPKVAILETKARVTSKVSPPIRASKSSHRGLTDQTRGILI